MVNKSTVEPEIRFASIHSQTIHQVLNIFNFNFMIMLDESQGITNLNTVHPEENESV